MGVFISWAIEGSLSHSMALHIKKWLPDVFVGQVECFVSSTDISAGSVWLDELFGQLESSQAGVVCVTRESMSRGWMLFEAGALAKMIGTQTQRVCPLLLDLDPGELQYPLAAFQWKFVRPDDEKSSRAQVLALVKMVNESIETSKQLTESRLLSQFTAFWPQFWIAYTELRAAQNNKVPHAPVQIGNNDILVEMRSGFRQMLNMLEREQQIEVQVECPNCKTTAVGEFYNAVGATRHFTCAKCSARFIAHLGFERAARTKLQAVEPHVHAIPAPASSTGSEQLQVSCPSCGGSQMEEFEIVPGSTRHMNCMHCHKTFVAHRMPNGKSKTNPCDEPMHHRFESYLRKVKCWVAPNKIEQLIAIANEVDSTLSNEKIKKTPTSLKKALIERVPQEPTGVVNTFVRALLHGGAFELVPSLQQTAFYQEYANRFDHEGLLQAFYSGQVRRLLSMFPDLGVKDFQEVGRVFQASSIPGADAALMAALQVASVGSHTTQPVAMQSVLIPPGNN